MYTWQNTECYTKNKPQRAHLRTAHTAHALPTQNYAHHALYALLFIFFKKIIYIYTFG